MTVWRKTHTMSFKMKAVWRKTQTMRFQYDRPSGALKTLRHAHLVLKKTILWYFTIIVKSGDLHYSVFKEGIPFPPPSLLHIDCSFLTKTLGCGTPPLTLPVSHPSLAWSKWVYHMIRLHSPMIYANCVDFCYSPNLLTKGHDFLWSKSIKLWPGFLHLTVNSIWTSGLNSHISQTHTNTVTGTVFTFH